MKFINKALNKVFRYSAKAVALMALVAVIVPFQLIVPTPARAQTVTPAQQAQSDAAYQQCMNGSGASSANCIQSAVGQTGAQPSQSAINNTKSLPVAPAGAAASSLPKTPKDALACSLDNPSVCLANVVYAFTVGLGSGLAYVGGFMLDTTIALSLNSSAYALSFLSDGWTTARDLANMAFILILVYIAFTIMFQAETAGTMKMLAWVIFIALIINFSFFFTRVVVDVGNIIAVQFYNGIEAPTLQQTMDATTQKAGVLAGSAAWVADKASPQGSLANTKDLTFSIMQALNLQELFSNNSFKAFAEASGFGTKFIVLSFLYLTIGACYFILAAMFFAVAVKFIVRVVVLWFLIIASPLAFICKAVPRPEVSAWYDKWQHELVNHAFYPAFFLFVFFFISTIMKSFGGAGGKGGILDGLAHSLQAAATDPNLSGFIFIASAVANVGIRLGFVIAMLYIALKASEYMGVKGAGLAHGITNRVGGLAKYGATLPVRGAIAGAGLVGRNTVGRGAYLLSRTSGVQNFAAKSVLGRPVKAALGSLEKASFDMRGMSVGKSLKNVAGEAGGKGGFGAQITNRAKNVEARAKELKEADERMVRNAQANYENNVYSGGKSAFDERKRILEEQVKTGNKEQKKAAEKELKDMHGAGKKQLDDAGKARIKAFADRLGNRNLQNLGWPSRGSTEGAAKALKTISGKSKEQTAIDALKELNADDVAPAGGTATPAAAAPAPATHPLTRQSMEATSERGPLSASTEKLERAIKNQVDALEEATHEFKEVNATLDRGFSGLRKTVKETLEKNGGGARSIEARGRSGRPIPAAPAAPIAEKPDPAPAQEDQKDY